MLKQITKDHAAQVMGNSHFGLFAATQGQKQRTIKMRKSAGQGLEHRIQFHVLKPKIRPLVMIEQA